jgi:hypothetical protein
MKRLFAIALSTSLAFQSTVFAQSQDLSGRQILPAPDKILDSGGMFFYSPEQFYMGELDVYVREHMPEVEALNGNKDKKTFQLMQFLMGEGTLMGFGVNPNRENFFDLYGQISVDVELDFPSPQYGETRESEGGKRYFPDHDAMHLWALRGVGPRTKDLGNRDKIINRWVKVLMDAEALATAYNSAYQVKTYWNWRMRNSGATPEQIAKFEEMNKGVLSNGSWDYQSFMDAVLTNVRGEPFKQNKLLKRHMTWESYKAAKEAGIPELVNLQEEVAKRLVKFTSPETANKLGAQFEEFFVKYLFGPVFSGFSFFRYKSGYLDLIKGTKSLMGYYYSPHYVRWATEFNIGEDIDTAEKKLAERIELFRQGKILDDVQTPKRGQYEVQRIRQLVTQMGRKLIELQDLAQNDPSLMNQADRRDSQALLERLKVINTQLNSDKERGTSYSDSQIKMVENMYRSLVSEANRRFPIDKYIPSKHRLGYAIYENFWADPYAIVLDRPIVLNKFVSTKGIWKRALQQRLSQMQAEMRGSTADLINTTTKPILADQLEEQAAARYNKMRKGAVAAEGQIFEDNYYLNRLEIFRRNLAQQSINFIEQVKEYQHISQDERVAMIEVAEDFSEVIDSKLKEFKNRYKRRFIEMSTDGADKVWLWDAEADVKWATEKSQVAMIEILDALDQGKKASKVKMKLSVIQKLTDMVKRGEKIEPSLYDMIRKVTPMKRGLLRVTCSAVSRMCFNQNLTNLIKGLPTKAYARDSQHPTEIEVVRKDGSRTRGMPQLPKDAIVIVGMNHDHAALDASYLLQVADALGIERNLLLTTQSAWPHFSIFKNKDPYLTLKEEPGFKDRVMNFFNKHKGTRVGFSIFPEGELPFWGVQFPLFANFGAFKLARRAAVENAGQRPVYYVEVHANFLRYVTAREDIPIKIDIIAPELVPATPIADRDHWIEQRRVEFENRANDPSRRGEMYDLIERRKIPGGRINTTEVPRRYTPAREVGDIALHEQISNTITCKEMLSK